MPLYVYPPVINAMLSYVYPLLLGVMSSYVSLVPCCRMYTLFSLLLCHRMYTLVFLMLMLCHRTPLCVSGHVDSMLSYAYPPLFSVMSLYTLVCIKTSWFYVIVCIPSSSQCYIIVHPPCVYPEALILCHRTYTLIYLVQCHCMHNPHSYAQC